jgi:GDP-L-fucose synthase
MLKSDKIYIAGHNGLVGSAIHKSLMRQRYKNIICISHEVLDLTNQNDTFKFFELHKPDYVFLAAAKVGGIYANNTYPADFIYDNLQIECNVIHAAYKYKVQKLLFLGSSCIYPRNSSQPIKEEYLMTGALEPTNAPYGLAKIAGIMMCESYNRQYNTNFISCMPTNLYGPGDNYHPENSHVLPAIIRRVHEAKITDADKIVIWGTGNPLREFLYVDDLADACIFLMQRYTGNETINVGSGTEIKIYDLTILIKEIIGYEGEIVTDPSKPDGTPRKFIDSSKIYKLGWKPKVNLKDGIKRAYEDFLDRFNKGATNG